MIYLTLSCTHTMASKDLCVICLSPMEKGKALFTTDCGHVFHYSCFKEAKRNTSGVFTCPLCRHVSPPSEMLSSVQVQPPTHVSNGSTGNMFSFYTGPTGGTGIAFPLVFMSSAAPAPPPPVNLVDDPLFEDLDHTIIAPQYQPANLAIVPEFPVGNVLESDLLTVTRIEAPAMVTENEIGIDLILVIDVSGSMDGSKIDAVKKTLRFVVSQMNTKSRLCLIKFNNNATKLTPLLQTTEVNKHVFLDAIDRLRADGGTDIHTGIGCAFDTLLHRLQCNQVTSVAMLTDGQDQGRDLRGRTQRGLASLRDVSLYTFGFGADHDGQLLSDIAKQGHGSFCYIEDVTQEGVATAFGNFLGGIVTVYAQNLVIKMTAQNGCTIGDVQTTYQVVRENPSTVNITIPDIFYEEKRCIPTTIHIPLQDPPLSTPECLLMISVSYDYTKDKTQKTLTEKLEINRVKLDSIPAQEPNHMVDEERNRLITALALATASQMGNSGHFHQARNVLKDAKQRIEKSVTANTEIVLQLIADLNKAISGLQSHATYSSGGGQYISQQQQTHYAQRATSGNCYYSSSNQRISEALSCSVPDTISDKIATIQMYIEKAKRLGCVDLIKNLEESLRLHQIWLETSNELTKTSEKRNEAQSNNQEDLIKQCDVHIQELRLKLSEDSTKARKFMQQIKTELDQLDNM